MGAISPINLGLQFKHRFENPIKKFVGIWEKTNESDEDKKALVLDIIESAIYDAINGGCQNYEIAREIFRILSIAGCRVEKQEAIDIAARLVEKKYGEDYLTQGFDDRFDGLTNAEVALRKRINEVAFWSSDNAFALDIPALDDLTGGVQPGEMMAISGAQGSMKTSLLLCGIERAISQGRKVLFFSLDMTPGEVQERRVLRRLRCGQFMLHKFIQAGDKKVENVINEIDDNDAGLFEIYGNDQDRSDLTITEVAALVGKISPDVLCIDYLTLLRRKKESDLECVNEVMPELKRITQRIKTRTILLSQMGRASKREQSSGIIGGHAKGGGIVEEMVHSEIELFKDIQDENGIRPIIATITKNRRGPSGRSYRLEYEPNSMRFTGATVRVERTGKKNTKSVFERAELV